MVSRVVLKSLTPLLHPPPHFGFPQIWHVSKDIQCERLFNMIIFVLLALTPAKFSQI